MSRLSPHGRGLSALLGEATSNGEATRAACGFDLWLIQRAYGEADELIERRLFRSNGWLDAWRRGEVELNDGDVEDIKNMRRSLQAKFHKDREGPRPGAS